MRRSAKYAPAMNDAARFLASGMRFRGRLCAAAVGVSFFIIIVALAVSGGFRKEISGALRQTGGDIVMTAVDGG